MSIPVREFMTPMPHSVGQNQTLQKAQEMMASLNCHHLPVLEGGQLVGIISDRDLKQMAKLVKFENVKVEEIMTPDPVVVSPTEDVFQVAMLMHQKKIGSVLVSATDQTKWGIFTATDALAYFSKER